MHEETEVSRRAEETFVRMGQVVVRPCREMYATLLRYVARSAARGAHDVGVDAISRIPGLGESGSVRLSKIRQLASHGTDIVAAGDVDTRQFARMMRKVGVPFAYYTDRISGERYVAYRNEDAGAIVSALKSYLGESLVETLGGHADEAASLAERMADPQATLDVADAKQLTDLPWEETGLGMEATATDDRGQPLRCLVRKDGTWEVFAGTEAKTGGTTLCVSDKPQALGEAMLAASAAMKCSLSPEATRVREAAIKTPEGAREAARKSIERGVTPFLDLGRREHRGIR